MLSNYVPVKTTVEIRSSTVYVRTHLWVLQVKTTEKLVISKGTKAHYYAVSIKVKYLNVTAANARSNHKKERHFRKVAG